MKLEKKTSEKLICNVHKTRHSLYLSRSVEGFTIRFRYGKMTEYLNSIAMKRTEQQQWFFISDCRCLHGESRFKIANKLQECMEHL